MSKYLRHSEFVPYAPDEVGRTVHRHHCKEGKGNNRLYITRKEGGLVLAYCHHCGLSGSYREDFYRVAAHKGHGNVSGNKHSGSEVQTAIKLPWGFNNDLSKATNKQREFLKPLTNREVVSFGIGFNGDDCVIPFYSNSGELDGYLIRTFDPNRPKYISKGIKGGRLIDVGNSTVCICEDWLSAICISRYCNAYALLGAHLNEQGLSQLVQHKKAIVFLDDDKPDIKMQQTNIKKRLQAFDIPTEVVHTGGLDPKEVDLSIYLSGNVHST